jgi:hypothetical protein
MATPQPVDIPASPLDDSALLAYSAEHLIYELWMLDRLNNWPSSLQVHPAEAQIIINALIESWVVHLRNLLDFLYPTFCKADDVVAAHFFPTEESYLACVGEISEKLKDARDRAHKEIAHLTIKRKAGAPKGKEWDRPDLTNDVLVLMKRFAQEASPTRLHESVRQVLGVTSARQ